MYYANLRYLIRGEDVRLNFVEKKENPVKRFFKKLFRIKDKESPILVIEETSEQKEESPNEESEEDQIEI